jgi:hypothetical protein
MTVCYQLHAPAALFMKNTCNHLSSFWVSPRTHLDIVAGKIFTVPAGNETPVAHPIENNYTDGAAPVSTMNMELKQWIILIQ